MKISAEPAWKENIVPGVNMLFKPVGRTLLRAARQAQVEAMKVAGLVTDEDIDEAFRDGRGQEITEAFGVELVRLGLVGWTNLFDDDKRPLPVNVDTIAAVLDHLDLGPAVWDFYVLPVLLRETEKNVSSPASSGTAAGETAAETTAETAPPAAAKTAPMKSTPRAPTSGKRPGKS